MTLPMEADDRALFARSLQQATERHSGGALDEALAGLGWHDALEEDHAAHTDEELREAFAKPSFSTERFLAAGRAVLDAVGGFWDGLEAARVSPGIAVER